MKSTNGNSVLAYIVLSAALIISHGEGARAIAADTPSATVAPKWAARTGHALPSYAAAIRYVAISPDGKYIVSVSGEDRAILWDVATGRIERVMALSDRATGAGFLPDGTPATFSRDGTIVLWHIETGEPLRRIHTGTNSDGMKLSRNGRRLVSRVSDSKVAIWDVTLGKRIREITVTRGEASFPLRLRDVDLSADGSRLLTVQFKGLVSVWDTTEGTLLRQWETGEYTAHHGSLSGDGTRAVIGTLKRATSIKVWNTETGTAIHEVKIDDETILRNGLLNHDGTRLLIHADRNALLFDVDQGKILVDLGEHPRNAALAFLAEQKRILTAADDLSLQVRDTETGAVESVYRTVSTETFAVVASRDGKHLAIRHGDSLTWWDLAGSRVVRLELDQPRVGHLALSHDGSTVAALVGENMQVAWKPGRSGTPVFRSEAVESPCTAVALGDDGAQLSTGHDNGVIIIWDIATGKSLQQLKHAETRVESLAFSGQWLLAGHTTDAAEQGTAVLWNLTSGDKSFQASHKGKIHSVALNKGETKMLCAGSDGAFIHDRATGNACQRFAVSQSFGERAFMNATGTRYLVHPAWNDMRIRTANGTELLQQKHGSIPRVAFAGDGSVVWKCIGHRVVAIDVSTGQHVLALQSLHQGRDWLAWTPDGKYDGSPGGIELVDFTLGTPEPGLASDPKQVNEVLQAKQELQDSNHVPGLIGHAHRGRCSS